MSLSVYVSLFFISEPDRLHQFPPGLILNTSVAGSLLGAKLHERVISHAYESLTSVALVPMLMVDLGSDVNLKDLVTLTVWGSNPAKLVEAAESDQLALIFHIPDQRRRVGAA